MPFLLLYMALFTWPGSPGWRKILPDITGSYIWRRMIIFLFVKQIVDAVENSLKQALPLFLSGLTAGMVQREPQIRASFPAPENSQPDSDVDWAFLGE